MIGKPGKPQGLPKFDSLEGICIGKCLHGKKIGLASITASLYNLQGCNWEDWQAQGLI